MRALRVALVSVVLAASFGVIAGPPAGADAPDNEYAASAGGNHDWVPASGAASTTASPTAVTFNGTMADSHGHTPYFVQSGPGIVRARQAGVFKNPYGLTARYDPILTARSTNYLTVTGPGSTVDVSLNLHVDGRFTSSCGSMTICDVRLEVQAQLGGTWFTVVSKEQGVPANQLGLTIDPIPGGVHVHGDVQTPVVTLSHVDPIPTALSIDVRASHLGNGFDSSSTWDARFDAVSFVPTGDVLNVPAGYTVSGDNVVDNAWTNPFTAPAAISGAVVYDVDGDGVRDASEPTLQDIDVFVDEDDDGTLDAGEPSYATDASGRYVFLGLDPGTYTIDYEVADLPVDFSNTGTKPLSVTVAAGDDSTGHDFFAEHPTPELGADYRFADTRASSVGTPPDLVDIGPGTNVFVDATVDGTDQRVLAFPDGNGLALTPTTGVIPDDRYTIVMQAQFEPFDNQAKLLIFDQGASITGGLVVEGSGLDRMFLSGVSCPGTYPTTVLAGEWHQFALTRDSAGRVHGFVDGIEQFSCNDSASQKAVVTGANGLQFFLGYPDVFHAAGSVARIRLFDNAMTATEIAALDQPATEDVVITDCDDPALATITTITGDLVADNVPSCDEISLPNLTDVGGDITITAENVGDLNFGVLETTGGDINVMAENVGDLNFGMLETTGGDINVAAENVGDLNFGMLETTGGDINVTAQNVGDLNFGVLETTGGDINVTAENVGDLNFGVLETTGGDINVTAENVGAAGTLDLGSLTDVAGDLTLDLDGYTEVDAATADGTTTIAIGTADAVMHVVLPAGTFDTAVPFTITHVDPSTLPPAEGTDADGDPATIDPVTGYQFTFDVPTLNADATLSFDVLLDGLDTATRDVLLAAIGAGNATLATRGDVPGGTYGAFPVCAGAEVPSADGCVSVELLDANGQPTTDPPEIVRFTGVTGHFSAWAVAIVEAGGSATVPDAPTGVTGVAGDGQVTVSWAAPGSDGGSDITGYTVTATPGSATCTWSTGPLSCVVTGLTNDTPYTFTAVATNAIGDSVASTASAPVTPVAPPAGVSGTLTPLTPSRILDTRDGTGLSGAFTPNQIQDLDVTGVGGVPANGVDAVVMNVAVTGPTTGGWLTVFPAGATLPTASSLNFAASQTVANLVVVKVGEGGADDGKVSIGNTALPGSTPPAGSVHVIADVVGWYADATTDADRFTGLSPARILDTRDGTGGISGAFAPNQVQELTVTGAGVPNDADAVVMNVAVTSPSQGGWLTVFPSGTTLPTASSLNFVASQTIANLVVAKVGPDGKVSIANTALPGSAPPAGTVHVIADVVGYYKPATGSTLTSIAPQRILDTRSGAGTPVGPNATITADPGVASGFPAAGSYSGVVVHVAVTGSTQAGWLTVFPSDESVPLAASLNFAAGQTVANLAKIKVGPDGRLKIANTALPTSPQPSAGSVHVIVDVVGYYA